MVGAWKCLVIIAKWSRKRPNLVVTLSCYGTLEIVGTNTIIIIVIIYLNF